MCWVLQVKKKVISVYQTLQLCHKNEGSKQIQKPVTYIKSTVENRSRVLILHPHGVGSDIKETDSAVPGGNQQELSRAGAELDSGDAVLWSLV